MRFVMSWPSISCDTVTFQGSENDMWENIETRVCTVQVEKKGMGRSAGWTRGFLLCVAVCVRPSQRCETRSRVHKRSVIYIWVHTYCPFSVHIYTRQMSGTVRRTDRNWGRKRESKVIYLNVYIDPPSFLFCWNISLPLFSLELAGELLSPFLLANQCQ